MFAELSALPPSQALSLQSSQGSPGPLLSPSCPFLRRGFGNTKRLSKGPGSLSQRDLSQSSGQRDHVLSLCGSGLTVLGSASCPSQWAECQGHSRVSSCSRSRCPQCRRYDRSSGAATFLPGRTPVTKPAQVQGLRSPNDGPAFPRLGWGRAPPACGFSLSEPRASAPGRDSLEHLWEPNQSPGGMEPRKSTADTALNRYTFHPTFRM